MHTNKYIALLRRSAFLTLLFLASACISEYHAEISTGEQKLLVVEGEITANTEAIFYITRTVGLDADPLSEETEEVEATLTLIADNGWRGEPARKIARNTYLLSIGELEEQVKYGVEIIHQGDVYVSTLMSPLRTPPIDELSWTQGEEHGNVQIRLSCHDDHATATTYLMWRYEETWEYKSAYRAVAFIDPKSYKVYIDNSAPLQYCWQRTRHNQAIPLSVSHEEGNRVTRKMLYEHPSYDDRFSILYHAKVKQRAVSREAYEYILDKQKYSNDSGGLFTPQPSQLASNITCVTNPDKLVIGFVDVAMNEEEQQLYIPTEEISRQVYSEECESYTYRDLLLFDLPDYSNKGIYNYQFRPLTTKINSNPDNPEVEFWTIKECADCRERGGTKEKPEGWPTEHQ